MSPKRFLPLLSISLILAGCTADLQIVTDEPAPQKATNTVAGEAILLLTETAADDFADAPAPASLDALGIRSIERVFPDAGPFEARHRAAGLHRWYRVSYDPTVSRTKADSDLRDLPGVEDVSFPPKRVLSTTRCSPGSGITSTRSNTPDSSRAVTSTSLPSGNNSPAAPTT